MAVAQIVVEVEPDELDESLTVVASAAIILLADVQLVLFVAE